MKIENYSLLYDIIILMQLSLLQLNINADNFWEQLIPFLTSHDFDILHLQEITGKETISGNIHSTRDVFAELQNILGGKYHAELAISEHYTSSPSAYLGNALFYKQTFPLLNKHILTLHQNPQPFDSNAASFENVGRNLLHVTLNIADKPVSFLTTHGAWGIGAVELPHHTRQGELLLNYLQTVNPPFILSGDFNISPNQPLIQKLSKLARNLTTEYHITNTLNPRTHHVKSLFPSGYAVDYIFTSPDLKVIDFQVLQNDISDHFGLTVSIDL